MVGERVMKAYHSVRERVSKMTKGRLGYTPKDVFTAIEKLSPVIGQVQAADAVAENILESVINDILVEEAMDNPNITTNDLMRIQMEQERALERLGPLIQEFKITLRNTSS